MIKYKEEYNAYFHETQDQLIAVQETLDAMAWTFSQKDEELASIESRIKTLNDRYKEEKEVI